MNALFHECKLERNKTGTNLKSPRGKTGGNFNDDELFRNAKDTSKKEKMEGDGMKNMEGEMKWNKNNVTDNCVVFYGCWPLRGQNPGLGLCQLRLLRKAPAGPFRDNAGSRAITLEGRLWFNLCKDIALDSKP